MKYFLSFLLLLVLLVFSFSQQTPAPETDFMTIYLSAEKEFRDAEKLSLQKNYSEEKEAEMNRSALKKLLQVISRLEAGQLDSLAFRFTIILTA